MELLPSRLSIVENIMKALKDDKIHMIGICGMGCIGKTSIVKEVSYRARKECMFHDVVRVCVSQEPDCRRIQHHIADCLGLKFSDDASVSKRADIIHQRLTQKERFLIVLDDLWERLDLEELGIPSTRDLKGCKFLLTSRSKALFAEMGPDLIFDVGPLSKEEARNLFFQCADCTVSIEQQQIAEQVADQCGGLPLKIKETAMSLNGQPMVSWRVALRELKRDPSNYRGMAHEALEWSYKFLESEETILLFRLCSSFPEHSKIQIEDLVRYCIGLRLFADIDNLQETRNRAHEHIETLKNYNLLADSDDSEYVKMEDVMQRMALSIKSKDNKFMVYTDILKRWPLKDSFTEYTSISLNCGEINELPDGLDCSNLKILKLTGLSQSSLQFPDKFFEDMKKIQVLDLRSASISSLPGSLQILANHRTLSLEDCALSTNDVSMIGNLKALEILSFASSDIKEIPSEMRKLSRLRSLDLTGCVKLQRIAPGVVSSLIVLEELYMKGTSVCWAEQMPENRDGEANASFFEVKSLPRLVVMEIYVPYQVLPIAGAKPGLFRKGKRYNK